MTCKGSALKFAFLMGLPLFAFFAAVALASSDGEPPVRKVGPAEARALIRENAGKSDFVILDVRTPEEFSQGHIEGAVLSDSRSPGFRQEMAGRDGTKTYLVYCRTGKRSVSAMEIMKELGFRHFYHLEGGITRWAEEGMPTVR